MDALLARFSNLLLSIGSGAIALGLMLGSLWQWGFIRPVGAPRALRWQAPWLPVQVDFAGFNQRLIREQLEAFNELIGRRIFVLGEELPIGLVDPNWWQHSEHGFVRIVAELGATRSKVHYHGGAVVGVEIKISPWLLGQNRQAFCAIIEHELGMALGLSTHPQGISTRELRAHRLSYADLRVLRRVYGQP